MKGRLRRMRKRTLPGNGAEWNTCSRTLASNAVYSSISSATVATSIIFFFSLLLTHYYYNTIQNYLKMEFWKFLFGYRESERIYIYSSSSLSRAVKVKKKLWADLVSGLFLKWMTMIIVIIILWWFIGTVVPTFFFQDDYMLPRGMFKSDFFMITFISIFYFFSWSRKKMKESRC